MSDAPEEPLRRGFSNELGQLRLQVEVMAMQVDENLQRMHRFLETGDASVSQAALDADDGIDAMNVSLTERCYELIAREAPVASDLRFVVSVLRVLSELERISDLSLRVVKLTEEWAVLRSYGDIYEILLAMAGTAVSQFRIAVQAWSAQDLGLAEQLARSDRVMDEANGQLTRRLLEMQGPDAIRGALAANTTGRSMDRIADHAAIIGARLRYLITGEPAHLATEIR